MAINRTCCVQESWKGVTLPHCFGTTPRNPVDHINQMKMEEVTNLLWIGFLMSENGPAGFRQLWRHLRHAAKHYLYDFENDQYSSEAAAGAIRKYAEELETLIIAEKVCTVFVHTHCKPAKGAC
jgi:hypothetical protein